MGEMFNGGLAIVGLRTAGSPASAQSLANGERIARTWCAGRHQVQAEAPRAGDNDVVPSLASIAQMNNTTETSLEVFLRTPRAKMPDYNLTPDEIHDVSAYTLSLKK